MGTELEPPPPVRSPEKDRPATPRRLDKDILEFLTVLAFAYVPGLLASVISLAAGEPANSASDRPAWGYLDYVPQVAQIAIPLLYIVHVNQGSWRTLGLCKPRWRDGAWAFPAMMLALVMSNAVAVVLLSLRTSAAEETRNIVEHIFPVAKSPLDYAAMGIASLAVGFTEELLFRGYILTRWQGFSGSLVQAVIVSSILFGIGHAYQGLAGVVSTTAVGLAFGLVFIYLRRLWPVALAHALLDFIALSSH